MGGGICISRPKEIEEITWMELDSAEPYLRIPEHLKAFYKRKKQFLIFLMELLFINLHKDSISFKAGEKWSLSLITNNLHKLFQK